MSVKDISVVIISKNAQETIEETLTSLSIFDEVILYLNNSTDKTEEIAQKFNNIKIIKGDFIGFGPTKNRAASFSKNEWIFSLDSDEITPKKLLDELKSINLNNKNNLFFIKRDNYFLGKLVKYSGWGKDYIARIYNKNSHQFNDNLVHEKIIPHKESKKITLKNSFQHQAITDISQFLIKINSYSKLSASNKKSCFFITVLAKSIFSFFKTYILQLGFLDGYRGFVIAVSNANGRFYRYLQRYINCNT